MMEELLLVDSYVKAMNMFKFKIIFLNLFLDQGILEKGRFGQKSPGSNWFGAEESRNPLDIERGTSVKKRNLTHVITLNTTLVTEDDEICHTMLKQEKIKLLNNEMKTVCPNITDE